MREISPGRIQRLSEAENTEHGYIPESEEAHLRDYWKILVKRRRLVVLVFLAVLGLGAYITFSTTPLYTVSATLRIEPKDLQITGIGGVLTAQAEGGPYDYYQTEFTLLKSRSLAAVVITKLGLRSNSTFTGACRPGLLDRLLSWLPGLLRSFLTYVFDFLGLVPKHEEGSLPTKIREFEFGVHPALIGCYRSLLAVEPVRNTRLVEVRFSTPNPYLSQDLANEHAATFLRMNLETRFDLTKEAREFLEKKLAEIKVKVERAEVAFNRFLKEHGVVSMEGGENIIVNRLVDLNSRLTAARAKRIELESLYQMVQKKDPQYLSQVIDNSLIQQVKGSLATLETEWARLSTTFTPEHPRLVELSKQISETRQRLNREINSVVRGIESQYATARTGEEALQTETDRQQQAALNLKELGANYVILQQEVNINRALYEGVLKRVNETIISNDIAASNLQIAERAEIPLSPSSPKTERNLLLAVALGLFLGMGLAFFLEYMDSTMKTPEDVWRAISVSTLGVVPNLRTLRYRAYGYGHLLRHSPTRRLTHSQAEKDLPFSQELIVSQHPFSIISESYYTIRTALLLSQAEKPPQVILFTSARPGDGKTLTTLNLAIALAQGGSTNVVVVDADLRKGRCHTLLHLQNHRGLTNILTNTLTLERGVQTTLVPGLSLLSRGATAPNPPVLLASPKMREVLEVLRERFDFVLIDSPPAIAVSDALVLSGLCDGVLLVLRGQETTAETARLVIERIEAAHARILGVILNGVDLRDPHYADYRSYYKAYYAAVQKEAEEQD